MEQIPKLSIQPAELPEEALTQIYQVRCPPLPWLRLCSCHVNDSGLQHCCL